MAHQRVEQDFPGAGHAAADHEHFGVGGGGNVCQCHAQRGGHLVHLTGSQCVPGAGGVEHVLGFKVLAAQGAGGVRVCVQQFLHAAHNAGGAGILLKATALAAAADGGLVGVDGDVADLAAGTVSAVDDLAVHDDAAAHAGAQCDHDGAAAALCRAHPDLAQSSHVGVVAHQHPDAAQQLAELNGDVAVAPAAKVCTYDGHDAGIQHRAGHAQTDTLDLVCGQTLFLHLLLHGSSQIFQNVSTVIRGIGAYLPLFQQLAAGGEQADLGGGAA